MLVEPATRALPPERLYTYGTLQLAPIMSQIVGRQLLGQPARLSGYARYCVLGQAYPAIIEASGAEIAGVVYGGLTQHELARLDAYEGPLYVRRHVSVEVCGQSVDACVYLLRPGQQSQLSSEPWDLERFERDHLESYLAEVSVTRRAPG